MNEENNKKEIIKGYFLGDTVFLQEETEYSKKNGFKLNDIAIVSKSDTKESLKGWKVIDYDKKIGEAIDKMSKEKIKELYQQLSHLIKETKK